MSKNKELFELSNKVSEILNSANKDAKKLNKKLLLIVLEDHLQRKSLLSQIIILNHAKSQNIKNIVVEASEELIKKGRKEKNPDLAPNFATIVSWADKENLKLIPADSNHLEYDIIRILNMKQTLKELNDNAVFIMGINHLKDFQNDVFLNQNYHIVALNNTNLV